MTDNVLPLHRRDEINDAAAAMHDPMCTSGAAYGQGWTDELTERLCNCDYIRAIREDERERAWNRPTGGDR